MAKLYQTWADGAVPASPETTAFLARESGRARVWDKRLTLAAILVSAVVLLAHAGLILGAGWGGDEFSNFSKFRDSGLDWYLSRTLQWSPRPLSDGLLFLYSIAVNHWRMALITPFLGLVWITLIAGTLAAAWQRGAPGLLMRLALAGAVLTLLLIGHDDDALFYWPMGAAAYLLDLTGIAVVTFQVINGGSLQRTGRLACLIGLAIAATSSETGLFFALAFTVALLALEFADPSPSRRVSLQGCGWLLLPLAIALAEVGCLVYVVATNPSRGINHGSIYYHHFLVSLAATLRTSVHEIFGGDVSGAGISAPVWLLIMGLLFVGTIGAAFRRAAPSSWRHLVALVAALAGCYYLTLLASYYEYGEAYNEPQASFRRSLVPLGVVAVAWIVGKSLSSHQHRWRTLAPAALLGAVCVAGVSRIPALSRDYSLLPRIREARELTWQSSQQPGRSMLFVVPPRGRLLTGQIPAMPGDFVQGAANVQWWQNGIMSFFGKQELRFTSLPTDGTHAPASP